MNKPSIQTRLVVDNERLSITMEYFNRFPIFRAESCCAYYLNTQSSFHLITAILMKPSLKYCRVLYPGRRLEAWHAFQ
ncbi:ATP synthase subunit delta [Trichinella spiralis]|uniref:ATP synthase subunit delta n=1 Tax=Trichinella spiralis TaxID=6334 RepID=A0ABR3KZD3_TRISP